MSTDIVRHAPTGVLAITDAQTALSQAQKQAFGIEEASEGEQLLFIHTVQRTGLDPAAKQIYMVGRWDGRKGRQVYTIQTGIDGYRLIAERTGSYVGSDESWVDGPDGKPRTATVIVRKLVAGSVFEFAATAHWDEYCQTTRDGNPSGLWARMPHRMLAKCAEALALRKAFPQDLSGIYTAEEMAQADSDPVIHRASREPQVTVADNGMAPRAAAVQLVLRACNGDGAKALAAWTEAGLPGKDAALVEKAAVEALVAKLTAEAQAAEADVVDAEIVGETPAAPATSPAEEDPFTIDIHTLARPAGEQVAA